MILKMCCVYDSKVGAYLPPMFFRSKMEAIRSFSSAVADESHQFCKYPEDYTLFDVGEWDDSTCKFTPHLTPISLIKAHECVRDKVAENLSVAKVG